MPINSTSVPDKFKNLLDILKARFENNMNRHSDLDWGDIQSRLESNIHKLESLAKMEETGGEPDVVGYDTEAGKYLFFDCSPESPIGRRSLCYDNEALESRKENKPKGNAISLADQIGIKILTESEYAILQQLGKFDLKTSSWIATPEAIRKLGGALFCDRRYDQVFTYHNGADSYYAARGFRGSLRA